MSTLLGAVATITAFLRIAFLAGGVVLATVAAADWAVRTRRLNPFGSVARFLRARVDPQLTGIERQVLRAGGRPTATPLWALMAYVIAAMLVLAGLDMLASLLRTGRDGDRTGGGGVVLLVAVRWTFGFLTLRPARPRHLVMVAEPRREPLAALVVRRDRVDAAPASRTHPVVRRDRHHTDRGILRASASSNISSRLYCSPRLR